MTHVPETTIAALLFAHRPNVNFAHIVDEMSRALALCPGASPVLTWDMDDVALFDLPGARVVLGWAEGLDGPHESACVVTAGPGPLVATGSDALGGRFDQVCGMIAERLEKLHGPALTVRHRCSGVMTAGRLGEMIERRTLGTAEQIARHSAGVRDGIDDQAVDSGMIARDIATDSPANDPATSREDAQAALTEAERCTAGVPDYDPSGSRVERLLARMEGELAKRSTAAQDETVTLRGNTVRIAADKAATAFTASGTAAKTMAMTLAKVMRQSDFRAGPETATANVVPRREEAEQTADNARAGRDLANGLEQERAALGTPEPEFGEFLPAPPPEPDPELILLRSALYPAASDLQTDKVASQSMPIQLAVGTMSATMILAVAPVGAALLTYNALGGADLRTTARVIALSGATMGLWQAQALRDLLSFSPI